MYRDHAHPKPYTVPWPEPVSRATGSGISTLAGCIRLSEIAAGHIPHALVFASDISCGPANSGPYRWPATSTDGNRVGEVCIPQGARVQLDPSIDLNAISGITASELAVGRALQTYGAYNTDVSGSRMSFGFETPTGGQVDPYPGLGLYEYFAFEKLPWRSLRVLESWNSTTGQTQPLTGDPTTIPTAPTTSSLPSVFPKADAFWRPVPTATPHLDPNNNAIVSMLSAEGASRVALLYQFGSPIVYADANTPRYVLKVRYQFTERDAKWGWNDLAYGTLRE